MTTSSPGRSRARRWDVARWRLLARGVALVLAVACMAGITTSVAAGSAAGDGGHASVQATQELVVLLDAHGVHQAPASGSPTVTVLAARRPITGEQTTVPVIARSIAIGGARWLQVMLPGRPNGSTGWISQEDTRALVTAWAIVVDIGARRVDVYSDARRTRSFQAVVGKPSTPTPTGRFFVEETLRMSPAEAGGPFALALSARSDVLQEFEGGPGQIAIHGRENLGGTLGSAASHGCIRLATASIEWLAARIGPGTPVTIEAG
jgi:lipoprotein-anchoring transpeptidase ErfK/SrfK